ncbi:MAG TPA: GNAT family N-acetyltransferase [Solirubrobacterales bacterium]
MSDPASIEPGAPAAATTTWRVREAGDDDVAAVASAVEELLVELGGKCPPSAALEAEAQALFDDPGAGSLLVADAGGEIVGVLVASWQRAMHVPGPYALIQDLWVDRDWRGRAIGADLIAAIVDLARERQVDRIEVGLPRESFAGIGATTGFYLANDFASLGIRMRRLLR